MRRILTDSGDSSRSRCSGRTHRRVGIKSSRTRPYRPRTIGNAERRIRNTLSDALCPEVLEAGGRRCIAPARLIGYYDEVHAHLGIGGRAPLDSGLARDWPTDGVTRVIREDG